MHALLHDLPGALLPHVPEHLLPYVYLSARLATLARETRAYTAAYAAMLPFLQQRFPPPRDVTPEEHARTSAAPTVLALNAWWLACSCGRAHVPLLWKGRLHHGMHADNACWNTYADVTQALPTFARFFQQRLLDTLYTNQVLVLEDQLGLYALTSTALQLQVRALPLVARARTALLSRLSRLQKAPLLMVARAWECCRAAVSAAGSCVPATLVALHPGPDGETPNAHTGPGVPHPQPAWQSRTAVVKVTDAPQLDTTTTTVSDATVPEGPRPVAGEPCGKDFFELPHGLENPLLRLVDAILRERVKTSGEMALLLADLTIDNGLHIPNFRFAIADHALRRAFVAWGPSERLRDATVTRAAGDWLRAFVCQYGTRGARRDSALLSALSEAALPQLWLPYALQWVPQTLSDVEGLCDRDLCYALAWPEMAAHPECIPLLDVDAGQPAGVRRAQLAARLATAGRGAEAALQTGSNTMAALQKVLRWRLAVLVPLLAPLPESRIHVSVFSALTNASVRALTEAPVAIDIWQLGRGTRALSAVRAQRRLATTLELAVLLARAIADPVVRALAASLFAGGDGSDVFQSRQLVAMVEDELCGALGEGAGLRVLKDAIRHPFQAPGTPALRITNVMAPAPLHMLYCSPGKDCPFCK
jgi:hypothetical protein